MPKISSKSWIYPLVLIFICLLLLVINYTPNTYLSGWDTLHPEFDFNLNFSRLINGVWRTDQGLGAVAGHSHMADLPRVIILWLLHFLLPVNFLRYAYIFLCLILGPLGFYYLAKYLIKNPLISFLGSLFYLLNISTVQQFYVPFEMFPIQWAFLPLVILYSLKFLQFPKAKNLLIFSLLTLLSTPQAYAAHLWYAFFGVYTLFLISYTSLNHHTLRHSLNLFVLTIILNSFWLLPNLYFITTSSQIPKNSKVNRLFSQEYRLENRATGTINNVALQKGFYFQWNVYNPTTSNFENLMPEWNNHLQNPIVKFSLYLFSLTGIAGLILSFLKKNKSLISLSPLFFIPLILLANRTPPFNYIFDLLLRFPLFEEALRFVFTKVSILFSLSLAIYFTYTLTFLFSAHNLYQRLFLTTFISTLLFVTSIPTFQGFLISPKMKIQIPASYFNLWKQSQTLATGKVLPLPLHNFTGWQYYSWGYQGAGFSWFGLHLPILDRDFDRWAPQNEEAFREFFYSLYSKDPDKFLATVEKYQIKYLLWDKDLIYPEKKNRDQILFNGETENLLNSLVFQNKITLIFQDQNIRIYQSNLPTPLIYTQDINNKFPGFVWNYWDTNYINSGDYLTTDNPKPILNLREQASLSPDPSITKFYPVNDQSLELPDLAHSQSYLVGIHSQYLSGLPPRLCLKNHYTNICTIYEELGKNKNPTWYYYILPPSDEFQGFTLTATNIDIPPYQSKNIVDQVSITPLDPSLLATNYQPSNNPKNPINFTGNNYFYKIQNPHNNTLVLSQSYHPGWIAFHLNGLKPVILDHVLVNNWANGWNTANSSGYTIYILFWPQVLEFIGFGLLPLTLFWLRRRQTRAHPTP